MDDQSQNASFMMNAYPPVIYSQPIQPIEEEIKPVYEGWGT